MNSKETVIWPTIWAVAFLNPFRFYECCFGPNTMMTSWNGNISVLRAFCAGNSPLTGELSSERPVTRSFDVSFDLCQNKGFSKQSRRRWFETPSRSLWRHCNHNGFQSIHFNKSGLRLIYKFIYYEKYTQINVLEYCYILKDISLV